MNLRCWTGGQTFSTRARTTVNRSLQYVTESSQIQGVFIYSTPYRIVQYVQAHTVNIQTSNEKNEKALASVKRPIEALYCIIFIN